MIVPMVTRKDSIPKSTVLVVLSLLYLVQFPKSIASTLSIQSKICGSDLFIYSNDSSEDFFFVNGKFVNNDTFCKAINFHTSSRCFVLEDDVYHLCGLVSSSDELPLKADKRILDRLDSKENKRRDLQSNDLNQNENAQKSLLTSKTLVIAAPAGFFIICCSFLCPCFHARRKQLDHSVHANKMRSVDSSSSLEIVSVNKKIPGTPHRDKIPASHLRDKIPASPLRDKFPASPLRDKFPASPRHDKFPASPLRDKIPGSPMRVPPSPSRFSTSHQLHRFGSIHLNFGQIAKATQNFSTQMQLGEGGIGTVYKAQLPDGHIVAIKRAKKEYFESLKYEFSSEVELLAKIEHRNLVKLLGYLDKENERLIITEYVPNGTLREHLDGVKGSYLDFNQRLEISIDVAHALTYLHLYSEKQIIHRDVKASNILLTESMRAKVSDFGFARLGTMDTDKTHIVTKVKGTVGYLDPEYMKTYKLTPKSDVYSFGVLLIEILTGRRPVELKKPADERVSLRWAFRLFNEGNVNILVDPMMQEVSDHDILSKMFELAFLCAAPTRSDRPDMKYVGEQLWAIRMDYQHSVRRG